MTQPTEIGQLQDNVSQASSVKSAEQDKARLTPMALSGSICSSSIGHFSKLLSKMFDGIDDEYFELADCAYSNSEQSMYFESMREVRVKRRGIEQSFTRGIEELFRNLLQNKQVKPVTAPVQFTYEEMALVEEDVIEENVILNNLTNKARSHYPSSLLHLATRFNTLIPNVDVDENNNPLDPKQIVHAFAKSLNNLDIDKKAKVVIFKQFEKHLLFSLEPVFNQANRTLADAGILPNLKNTISRSRSHQPTRRAATETLSEAEINERYFGEANPQEHTPQTTPQSGLFARLQQLLGEGAHPTAGQRPVIGSPSATRSGTPSMQHDELLGLLDEVQREHASTPVGEQPAKLSIGNELRQLLASGDRRNHHRRVGDLDEDVINVIEMLFEFILNDDNIPSPMQALIGRLQIPILKVALKDKSFFNNNRHPARRLLNDIARASIGWEKSTDKQRDGLYKKAHDIVQNIIDDYEGNPELFDELCADFRTFLTAEYKRAEVVEKRTREAAEGLARSEASKNKVSQLIRERVENKHLPSVVVNLLQNPWSQLLVLIDLKEGTESEAWKKALTAVDELMWSIQPHQSVESKRQWVRLMPSLMRTLRDGLKQIAYHPADTTTLLKELWEIHGEIINNRTVKPSDQQDDKAITAKSETSNTESNGRSPEDASVSAEDEAAAAKAREKELALQPYAEKVNAMNIGDWVEFALPGGTRLRCKLAAKIRATEKVIFVNRRGAKVAERNIMAFADELRKGTARPLDNGLLIDRALDAVIGRLSFPSPNQIG